MNRILRFIVLLLPWTAACLVVFWLFLIRYPASGVTTFSFPFDGRSLWFTPFQPGERVTSPGVQPDGWTGQRILFEPVYGSSRLPGPYDTLKVSLEIRPLQARLSELGILRDEEAFAFEMKPLWSEALQSGWHAVEVGGQRGLVRDGVADDALLSTDSERLMVWHATSTNPALVDSSGTWTTHEVTLRGAHDFHVVPVNGEIRFSFLLQDVNRSREGKNLVAFRLTKGDELLWSDAVSASGVSDRTMGTPFTHDIRVSDLAPGVYKLSFAADNDLFIRSLTTNAKRWVIGPRIYFGDRVGFRATSTAALVWTNSLHAVVDTFHPEGRQTVSLGSNMVYLKQTHVPYALDRKVDERLSPVEFRAPQGNVRFIGDGYVALSRENLFLPYPRRFTYQSDPTQEGIQAILTPYLLAKPLPDGWWQVEARFDHLPTDSIKYSLGLPGTTENNGALDIRHVELEYVRDPNGGWLAVLRRELSAIKKRLWN